MHANVTSSGQRSLLGVLNLPQSLTRLGKKRRASKRRVTDSLQADPAISTSLLGSVRAQISSGHWCQPGLLFFVVILAITVVLSIIVDSTIEYMSIAGIA